MNSNPYLDIPCLIMSCKRIFYFSLLKYFYISFYFIFSFSLLTHKGTLCIYNGCSSVFLYDYWVGQLVSLCIYLSLGSFPSTCSFLFLCVYFCWIIIYHIISLLFYILLWYYISLSFRRHLFSNERRKDWILIEGELVWNQKE